MVWKLTLWFQLLCHLFPTSKKCTNAKHSREMRSLTLNCDFRIADSEVIKVDTDTDFEFHPVVKDVHRQLQDTVHSFASGWSFYTYVLLFSVLICRTFLATFYQSGPVHFSRNIFSLCLFLFLEMVISVLSLLSTSPVWLLAITLLLKKRKLKLILNSFPPPWKSSDSCWKLWGWKLTFSGLNFSVF